MLTYVIYERPLTLIIFYKQQMNNVTTVSYFTHFDSVAFNLPQKFDSVAYFTKKQFHER